MLLASLQLLTNGSSNGAAAVGNASPEVLASYPSYETKMQKTAEPIQLLEKINGGAKGLEWVTDCCVDAASSYFPLARYVVGWDAQLIDLILKRVPEWIVDRVQTAQD